MTDEFINRVTIDCLLNKGLLNKGQYYKSSTVTRNNKKDKKFYKKRIYNLTRDLIVNKEQDCCFPADINSAFDNYVNTCIAYFKNLDKTDILQDDYKDIVEPIQTDINEQSIEKADKLLMRSIQFTPFLASCSFIAFAIFEFFCFHKALFSPQRLVSLDLRSSSEFFKFWIKFSLNQKSS